MKHIFVSVFLIVVSSPAFPDCLPGQEDVKNETTDLVYCRDCPDNYYSKDGVKCRKCKLCHRDQTTAHQCTTFRDRYCVCPPGKFLNKNSICVECSICHPGTYQVLTCEHNKDRQCHSCPTGYTTNTTNAKRCLIHSNSRGGDEITINNKVINVNMEIVISVMAVVAFFVIIAAVVTYYFKCVRKKKRQKRVPIDAGDAEHDIPLEAVEQRLLPNNNEKRDAQYTMLRNVPADIVINLGMKLNSAHPRNWIHLAGKLGFNSDQVGHYKLKPQSATQDILHDWSTNQDATVFKLYTILLSMHRGDAADLIEQHVYNFG